MKNPFASKKPAQTPPPSRRQIMTNARLSELINELSGEVQGQLGYWKMRIESRDVLVITLALLLTGLFLC